MAELALENNFRRQLNQERGGETLGQLSGAFDNKYDFTKRLAKEVAHKVGRRYLPEDMMDELENMDFDEGETLAHFAGRFAGNYYKGKAFRKLVADPAKQVATRAIMNRLKIAFGVTLIGAIVSWLIMTVQMIWGNWLHKFWMPSLYIWEQFVWGVGAFLVVILIIINIVLYIVKSIKLFFLNYYFIVNH
jgi:hypothetical protein